MMNFKQLYRQPLRTVPISLIVILFLVALIGFADSSYLTLEHYQGRIPPCTTTANCDLVLTSSYSSIAGLPVALLGSIYYLLILIGLFAYFESRNINILKSTLLFTVAGLLASMVFVFIQVFLLRSYCQYCLLSALTSTILFAGAMHIFLHHQES